MPARIFGSSSMATTLIGSLLRPYPAAAATAGLYAVVTIPLISVPLGSSRSATAFCAVCRSVSMSVTVG